MIQAEPLAAFRVLRLLAIPALLLAAFAAGSALRGPAAGAQVDRDSEPAKLRPARGRRGVEVRLTPGEILLLQFLQRYSDYSGQVVYVDGEIPPNTPLDLAERMPKLETEAVTRVLRAAGYELSQATIRGERAWWVQRTLRRPTKKGALTPSKDRKATALGPGSTPEPAPDRGLDAQGEPALCLYRRENGTGAAFVVVYESASRRDAEEALSLLEAHRRAQR